MTPTDNQAIMRYRLSRGSGVYIYGLTGKCRKNAGLRTTPHAYATRIFPHNTVINRMLNRSTEFRPTPDTVLSQNPPKHPDSFRSPYPAGTRGREVAS